MTSRQRVTKAIRHLQPDRMPIDLGMYTASGISAFAYQNLRAHLGLSSDAVEIHDCVQTLARVDRDILERFHCDCMLINPPISRTNRWKPRPGYEFIVPPWFHPFQNEKGEWVVEKGGRSMRMPVGGFFFDGDWLDFSDLEGPDRLARYAQSAERIFEETEYFTAFRGLSPFYSSNLDYFCDMITDPEPLMERNKALFARQIETMGQIIDCMGRTIGAVCMSGDLGGQTGPLCKPSAFEQVVMPFLKPFNDFVHRNSDLKVFLHCCGGIEPLIPLLIDCGIDILNPVQISATGMDPARLKEKYGKDIVFWGGGCNTQHVLGTASPEAVAENVRTLTDIFKPG
ncbi:MAG TPA: uroporphyrinogen decarboxylase family protein, partial [Clostridia bacterium]|nr:uroporphyrinogen decarboxylase family protein [Clostridia bacterium]